MYEPTVNPAFQRAETAPAIPDPQISNALRTLTSNLAELHEVMDTLFQVINPVLNPKGTTYPEDPNLPNKDTTCEVSMEIFDKARTVKRLTQRLEILTHRVQI